MARTRHRPGQYSQWDYRREDSLPVGCRRAGSARRVAARPGKFPPPPGSAEQVSPVPIGSSVHRPLWTGAAETASATFHQTGACRGGKWIRLHVESAAPSASVRGTEWAGHLCHVRGQPAPVIRCDTDVQPFDGVLREDAIVVRLGIAPVRVGTARLRRWPRNHESTDSMPPIQRESTNATHHLRYNLVT